MKTQELHGWQVTPREAISIQKELAGQVSRINQIESPHFIAGADISIRKSQDTATAAVVVLSYPELIAVETSIIKDKPGFPYIPGLLSFRESPLVIKACQALSTGFDLMLVDGQGIAHPRRMGLASHLGLLLGRPTIGCAKSRLIGEYTEPAAEAGEWTEITHNGEVIGAAVRTRQNTRPVYVSIGHKIDLPAAMFWVMACCRGYRIPEPTRLAHIAAGRANI